MFYEDLCLRERKCSAISGKKHYMEQINAIKSLWRILFAIPSNPFLINPIEYNNKSETHRKTRNEKNVFSYTSCRHHRYDIADAVHNETKNYK